MVMRTEVNISFRIPKYAVDFLEKMRSQSSSIYFEILCLLLFTSVMMILISILKKITLKKMKEVGK